MEKITVILAFIGFGSLVFSFWTFRIVKRHIRGNRGNLTRDSDLSDLKYFELKSRQEYLVSLAAILLALLTFLGFSSLNDIKKDMQTDVQSEKTKLDSLYIAEKKQYGELSKLNSTYKDSVSLVLDKARRLKQFIEQIRNKDIIRQNIFIVDPLTIGNFPIDKNEFRTVKFKDLKTISGKALPIFKTAPSIVCFSTTYSMLIVADVTSESFKIKPELYYSDNGNDARGNKVKFSVWISQKPQAGEFGSDFNDDFK
jgi:hypothetical protein